MTDKYADLDVDTLRTLLVRRDEQIIELKDRLEHLEDVQAGLEDYYGNVFRPSN